MVWAVFGGLLLVLLGCGAYIGIAMGVTGLILLHFFAGGATDMMPSSVWNTLNSFSLTAMPVFILMGEILVHSGLSRKMYDSLSPLFERLPGKLFHTNVVVCALFGAMSGSSSATAAAIGSVVYPELKEREYDCKAVAGSLAGAGTLGMMIPPSMALILYGAWQDVSVGSLFIAGVIPGIMIALIFMIFIAFRAGRYPDMAPDSKDGVMPLAKAIFHTKDVWPVMVLIFAIMGTIYLGLATPTESASLGVGISIILGILLGDLDMKSIWKALVETANITGLMGLILLGASILTQAISILGLPRQLAMVVVQTDLSPMLVLIAVYLLYLVLGCFFDGISMLVMTLPFVFPVIITLGHDPVWFGIAVIVVMEIGMITPPFGANLYMIEMITGGEVKIMDVSKACIPYWLLLLISLALLTIFPEIATWLPSKTL